jgi:2-polyprenyl-3-methyl-5-hydroxy-6-metoxy-1,4-benzoquinol methylase
VRVCERVSADVRTLRERILDSSTGYGLFLKVIRADRFMTRISNEHIRLRPGHRLLDIGCGDGALSEFVGDASYTGVDNNQAYIQTAKRRHSGATRRFICADLADLRDVESGTYDVVSAVGVLHHLDDDLATQVIEHSLNLLTPGGRFVAVDPVLHPEQRSIARVLMALDRGKYVRHPGGYSRLAPETGVEVDQKLIFDLNPFPYTHSILELTKASEVARP